VQQQGAMKKHVVLPQAMSIHALHTGMHQHAPGHPDHPQHHRDPFHQFEGLLGVLVVVHLAAFGFWCYLLYASRKRKQEKAAAVGGSSSVPGASSKLGDWRSPRDVLKAYQKAHLGKS
jgi:hypothetical protein